MILLPFCCVQLHAPVTIITMQQPAIWREKKGKGKGKERLASHADCIEIDTQSGNYWFVLMFSVPVMKVCMLIISLTELARYSAKSCLRSRLWSLCKREGM